MTCRRDADRYRGHLTSLNMLVRVEGATLQVMLPIAHVLYNVTTTSAGGSAAKLGPVAETRDDREVGSGFNIDALNSVQLRQTVMGKSLTQ